MISRCEVTETAVALSVQLEVYRIPDDFDAGSGGRRAIAVVRDRYTNYRQLLQSVPRCPEHCPLLREPRGVSHCFSHQFVHDMLERDARRLATCAYDAWLARKQSSLASERLVRTSA